MKTRAFFLGILAAVSCTFAVQVSITGTVTDADGGAAIANATIKLKGQPHLSATSDASGNYSISGETQVVSVQYMSNAFRGAASLAVTGTHFSLKSASPEAIVSLQIFAFNGMLLHASRAKNAHYDFGAAPEGMYLVKLSIDNSDGYIKLLKASNTLRICSISLPKNSSLSAGNTLAKAFAEPVDTLLVSAAGYVSQQVPIASYTTTKDIAMLKAVAGDRATDNLLALYTFKEGSGNTINDVSGVGEALNISITDPDKEVTWIESGGISVKPSGYKRFEAKGTANIVSTGPASKISEACKASNTLTVEMWVKLGTLDQAGPERIATISSSTGYRNITMSYQSKCYDIRLRTTSTNNNGLPAIRNSATNLATTEMPTHVVYTYNNPGAHLFVNGVEVGTKVVDGTAPDGIKGTFANWDTSLKLRLANEFGGERAWWGDIYLLAYYSTPLTAQEVEKNYNAKY
jgi:hypothetical protein